MFKIGQKVVCVNDDPDAFEQGRLGHSKELLAGLTKGRIYTVRFCGPYISAYGNPYIGVRVEEIFRGNDHFPDLPFHHERFRPLRETSIDVFTQMLVKVPETVV